jgi:hypothetical protein
MKRGRDWGNRRKGDVALEYTQHTTTNRNIKHQNTTNNKIQSRMIRTAAAIGRHNNPFNTALFSGTERAHALRAERMQTERK